MGQRNPNHQLIDGKHPIMNIGFQPSFWFCRISKNHPQYHSVLIHDSLWGHNHAGTKPSARAVANDPNDPAGDSTIPGRTDPFLWVVFSQGTVPKVMQVSMDCFKGKSTGNHVFLPSNTGFSCNFSHHLIL